MPEKVDLILEEVRLTRADVKEISAKVEGHLAHCNAEHRRVDERAGENRRRIITLEEVAQENHIAHAKAQGGWTWVAKLAAAVAAGAGLTIAIINLVK